MLLWLKKGKQTVTAVRAPQALSLEASTVDLIPAMPGRSHSFTILYSSQSQLIKSRILIVSNSIPPTYAAKGNPKRVRTNKAIALLYNSTPSSHATSV